MAVNIKPFNQPYLYNYKYDQLNRLTAMDAFTGLDTAANNWSAITATKSYNERVSYDACPCEGRGAMVTSKPTTGILM